jgi:hypothetical protein
VKSKSSLGFCLRMSAAKMASNAIFLDLVLELTS